jgi:hypothetical protein
MSISVVQTNVNSGFAGTLPYTSTITLSQPVLGNSLIVATVLRSGGAIGSTPVVTGVADSAGNTYSRITYLYDPGNYYGGVELWWCSSVTATGSGTLTITVSFGGVSGTAAPVLNSLEASGIATIDQSATNYNNSGTATTLAATLPSNNANASELVVAFVSTMNYSGGSTIGLTTPPSNNSVGGAFTNFGFYDNNGGNFGGAYSAGYKITSSVEDSSALWSWTGANAPFAIIASFAGASSPQLMGQAWL